ncbi:MAG: hypothetical protein NWQ37_18525, partial [Marivita lacus]|nr:hypothetical protein [Marivita lacus]
SGTYVDPANAPEIMDLAEDEVVIVAVPAGASAGSSITIDTDGVTGDSIVQLNGQTVVVVLAGAGPVSLDQILVVENSDVLAPAAA